MNSRGSTALVIALSLGLVALVGGVYFVYSGGSKEPAPPNNTEAFEDLKIRVNGALDQPAVVNATVERNFNSFGCFYTAEANCAGKGGLFQLYDGAQKDSPILSHLSRDGGFNAKGEACRGFPSAQCPLRVEAFWEPVCREGGPCEGTRSARVKVKVMLNAGEPNPQDWVRQELFTPQVRLGQSATCERGGGVWAVTECITPGEASQRQIASGGGQALAQAVPENLDQPTPVTPEVSCPNEIQIQGDYLPVELLGPARARVRMPAMNGCPDEDVFVFQCQARQPDDREGQWIQVEALMANACDNQGVPLAEPTRPDFIQ
jgi:hypothetical protein